MLSQDDLYPHPERLVTFIGNHDTKRFLSEPGAKAGALHLAFGLLATMRGMPQLYYGDEIEMSGGDDPDNRKDFPGGFPKDKRDAFNEIGRTASQQTMHHWVETMMQLRSHLPALQAGKQQTLRADKDSFAFLRGSDLSHNCTYRSEGERLLVVVNNDFEAREVTLPIATTALANCTHFEALLKNEGTLRSAKDTVTVSLPAQEIGIFRAQP